MAASEEQRERLRTVLVEMLLEIRAAYLKNGASPLKHWDQLQNRSLSAARRASTADEWVTMLCRGLQLPSLSSSASSALLALSHEARETGQRVCLDVVERDLTLLLAMARKIAEDRRDARDAEDERVNAQIQANDESRATKRKAKESTNG